MDTDVLNCKGKYKFSIDQLQISTTEPLILIKLQSGSNNYELSINPHDQEFDITCEFLDHDQTFIEFEAVNPTNNERIASGKFEINDRDGWDKTTYGPFKDVGRSYYGMIEMDQGGNCEIGVEWEPWIPPKKSSSVESSKSSKKLTKEPSTEPVAAEPVVMARSASTSSTSARSNHSSSTVRKVEAIKTPQNKIISYDSYSTLGGSDEGELINKEINDYNDAIDIELERVKKVVEIGKRAYEASGPLNPALKELETAVGKLNELEGSNRQMKAALERRPQTQTRAQFQDVRDFCRARALSARRIRIDLANNVLKCCAMLMENEQKKAKRAAHKCRALAGIFAEKCPSIPCKETQVLVDKNTVTVGEATDEAKQVKLAVKKARVVKIDDIEPHFNECVSHRKIAELKVDELELTMSKYDEAMIRYYKKRDKKARLKEEAILLQGMERERDMEIERHMRYLVDMDRPRDNTYHEIEYHNHRTATCNHNYRSVDHHKFTTDISHLKTYYNDINHTVITKKFDWNGTDCASETY